jgi:3-oxoacyl-[acyl-carrier protein] reductase
MIETVAAERARLDILVNNAAVRKRAELAAITQAEWREVLGVILDGAFNCAQAAAPYLSRGGCGRIINVGGESAFTGARDHAHVIAAKSGLQGLTRALAVDLAPQQVTVNMVSPGFIESKEDDPKRTAERRMHYAMDRIPLGHPGSPDDIAAIVVAVATDSFKYVTGQTIRANGGFFMG